VPGSGARRRARARGRIEELPSGSLRVSVYTGIDPVTKRRHYLREVVPAGPRAMVEAEKVARRLAGQVDERRHPRTTATVDQLLDRYFELVTVERSTLATYTGYADKHIRPLIGQVQVGALDADVFDSFYAELRRCREHCTGARSVEHRTPVVHKCDPRCRPHTCRPLGASTIRQIHFILSGALKRAVRWRWIATNPCTQAEPPAAPKPNPRPPTAQEAAQILSAAWADPDWGALVWLTMVTGMRRGELCGLRWRDVDLDIGVVALSRSIGQRNAQTWEKDTKTHQHRRIALDPETVEILREHHGRCRERADALGVALSRDAFVFSLAPDGSSYLRPNSVSERYSDLVDALGIETSLHKLRHYSATELITAGVDVRTVAGRLGHSGGGTTTLRTYAAWVSESDQRAAGSVGSRMPTRPIVAALPPVAEDDARAPYLRIAGALQHAIEAGLITPGSVLPAVKQIASAYGVSVGTAHRALGVLAAAGHVESRGAQGTRVVWTVPDQAADLAAAGPADCPSATAGPRFVQLEIRCRGEVASRLMAVVDPRNPAELERLLADALRRAGRPAAAIGDYEMDIRGEDGQDLGTFVVPSPIP
jgi:integrase